MFISDKTIRNAINSTYPVEKKKFLCKRGKVCVKNAAAGVLAEISNTNHMTVVLAYPYWPLIKSKIETIENPSSGIQGPLRPSSFPSGETDSTRSSQ